MAWRLTFIQLMSEWIDAQDILKTSRSRLPSKIYSAFLKAYQICSIGEMESSPADSLPSRGKQPLFFKGVRFWSYKLVITCFVKKSCMDRRQFGETDILILNSNLFFNISNHSRFLFQCFLCNRKRNIDPLLPKILRDKTYLFSSLL